MKAVRGLLPPRSSVYASTGSGIQEKSTLAWIKWVPRCLY